MNRDEIKIVVRETIEELRKMGLLKSEDDIAYPEINSILSAYYADGERDKAIRAAVDALKEDDYYKLIPLYYSYGYTHEKMAEVFGVDVSTITRNKKRLCMEVWKRIK